MKIVKAIPKIDLSPLWDDAEQGIQRVAEQVRWAFTIYGFAYLVNHNVPKAVIDDVFWAAKQFHALPLEEKMRIKQNDCFRGYVPINASQLKVSTLGEAKKPNQLDAFVMAFEVAEDHPDYKEGVYLAGPNQWPEGLEGFQEKMLRYRDVMLMLARKLVQVFSVAFGMSSEDLDRFFEEPSYFLRLQHYPEQPASIPDDQFGIAPHTDYGFFTLLAQGDVPGLEVQTPDGSWVTVPCLEGALILNSGDMLKRWSNDTFRSTPHRVINRSGTERFSVPFFFEPNMHAMIEPLASCIDDEAAKHDPVMYGDYLMERIQGNYGLGSRS